MLWRTARLTTRTCNERTAAMGLLGEGRNVWFGQDSSFSGDFFVYEHGSIIQLNRSIGTCRQLYKYDWNDLHFRCPVQEPCVRVDSRNDFPSNECMYAGEGTLWTRIKPCVYQSLRIVKSSRTRPIFREPTRSGTRLGGYGEANKNAWFVASNSSSPRDGKS